MSLWDVTNKYKDAAIADRRHLHENPELGLDLPQTQQYVMDRLREIGYEPAACGKSGVTATIGKAGKKTLLLRADMDALPVEEASGEPFASGNQNMHACGHDMHTGILLGVARILKEKESELEGTVKLMFQPGEEIFAGAKDMIDAGLMENPSVDAALALHVFTQLPAGKIYMREGPFMASVNGFKITIFGKGCHGAQPENGVDPILIGTHIFQNLQAIPARETSLTEGVLVTIGQFSAGNAANVIPDTAVMQGTMRTFNEPIREEVYGRIEAIAKQTAELFRGRAEVEKLSDVPCVVNDPALTATVRNYFNETDGLPEVKEAPQATGSEDFAFLAKRVPSTIFLLGAAADDEEKVFPQHHPKAVFNEDAVPVGMMALATAAIRWLQENQ